MHTPYILHINGLKSGEMRERFARKERGYRERAEGGKGIAILHGSLQYLYFGILSLQKYWIINRSIRKFICSSA